jgi:hypothetical protein
MGVCQISLEEININSSQQILDWYKLFSVTSLMNNYTTANHSLTRGNSITTNDSFSSLKANSRYLFQLKKQLLFTFIFIFRF